MPTAAALAVAAFAALCAVVLSVAPRMDVEPDDVAYQASIVAMTEGHFLSLSRAQANALAGSWATAEPSRSGPARTGRHSPSHSLHNRALRQICPTSRLGLGLAGTMAAGP
jgi:hypothetical protein